MSCLWCWSPSARTWSSRSWRKSDSAPSTISCVRRNGNGSSWRFCWPSSPSSPRRSPSEAPFSHLGGPQQRAVLAMLVLYRDRGLSDDRIVEYLWADQPPARALPTLQAYISHLRRRLEPQAAAGSRSGVIVRQGRGYAVRLPVDAVDAWRFEQLLDPVDDDAERVRRLTEALALWRGTPLAEYAHLGWAQAEISRLEEMRSVARELVAAARVDRGDAAVMVAELEAMV